MLDSRPALGGARRAKQPDFPRRKLTAQRPAQRAQVGEHPPARRHHRRVAPQRIRGAHERLKQPLQLAAMRQVRQQVYPHDMPFRVDALHQRPCCGAERRHLPRFLFEPLPRRLCAGYRVPRPKGRLVQQLVDVGYLHRRIARHMRLE